MSKYICPKCGSGDLVDLEDPDVVCDSEKQSSMIAVILECQSCETKLEAFYDLAEIVVFEC